MSTVPTHDANIFAQQNPPKPIASTTAVIGGGKANARLSRSMDLDEDFKPQHKPSPAVKPATGATTKRRGPGRPRKTAIKSDDEADADFVPNKGRVHESSDEEPEDYEFIYSESEEEKPVVEKRGSKTVVISDDEEEFTPAKQGKRGPGRPPKTPGSGKRGASSSAGKRGRGRASGVSQIARGDDDYTPNPTKRDVSSAGKRGPGRPSNASKLAGRNVEPTPTPAKRDVSSAGKRKPGRPSNASKLAEALAAAANKPREDDDGDVFKTPALPINRGRAASGKSSAPTPGGMPAFTSLPSFPKLSGSGGYGEKRGGEGGYKNPFLPRDRDVGKASETRREVTTPTGSGTYNNPFLPRDRDIAKANEGRNLSTPMGKGGQPHWATTPGTPLIGGQGLGDVHPGSVSNRGGRAPFAAAGGSVDRRVNSAFGAPTTTNTPVEGSGGKRKGAQKKGVEEDTPSKRARSSKKGGEGKNAGCFHY